MRATLAYDEAGEIVAVAVPGGDVEQGHLDFAAGPGQTKVDIETDDVKGLSELVGEAGEPEHRHRRVASALLTHFRFDARSGSIKRRR